MPGFAVDAMNAKMCPMKPAQTIEDWADVMG
jgi:hypothetical protein